MLRLVIGDASPLLECIHPELDRHNGVINIISVVVFQPHPYPIKVGWVVLVQLNHHGILESILCSFTDCPMAACVELVKTRCFWDVYNHIVLRSPRQFLQFWR